MYSEIKKFPVIIVSSPRTGSTALGYDIKKHFESIEFINEPFNHNLLETHKFVELWPTNRYILKAHIFDLQDSPLAEQLRTRIINGEVHLIRIRRRNVVEQITSYYIELIRNKWGYHFNFVVPEHFYDPVPLDVEKMNEAMRSILLANKKLDEFDAPVNVDVWFEDLNILPNNEMMVTPKPNNYIEVRNTFTEMLKR